MSRPAGRDAATPGGAGSAGAVTLPGFGEFCDRWARRHGGLDPRRSPTTRRWLRVVYRLARPLVAAGVSPDLLTTAAVLAGLLTVPLARPGRRWALFGAACALGSGVLDNLDGAVAALTDRSGGHGALFDALADRVVDSMYAVAFWRLGAPAGLSVAAGAVPGLLEYTRARAGGPDDGLDVITVGERPVRVLVAVAGFAGVAWTPPAASGRSAVSGQRPAALAGTAAAAATTGLATVGWWQLIGAVRRRPR